MNMLLVLLGLLLIIVAIFAYGNNIAAAFFIILIGIAIMAFAFSQNRKKLKRKEAEKQLQQSRSNADSGPYGPPVGPVTERRLWNVDSSFRGMTKTYYLAGVTFHSRTGQSRQQILSLIAEGIPPWDVLSIELNEYSFNGERAVAVVANGVDVGNIRRDDLAFFFRNAHNLFGVVSFTSSDFLDDSGNRKYSGRLTLAYDNVPGYNAATSSNPSRQGQNGQANKHCPSCGTTLVPGFSYCPNCGLHADQTADGQTRPRQAPPGEGFAPGSHWQHRGPV